MTDERRSQHLADVRAAAADWFARTRSDAAGEADWLALEAWLSQSPDHLRALEEVERLWLELDDASPAPTVRVMPPPTRKRGPVLPSWAPAAIAASLVLAVCGLYLMRQPAVAPLVLETAKGQTRTVVLADGSHVQLNSATRVDIRMERRERRAFLDHGEAAFDVSKDPNRPFIVAVADQQVRVVGTEFDILRDQGRVTVSVRRGVVEVRPSKGGDPSRLHPGDQMVHREGDAQSMVHTVSADDAFAWKQGYVVYKDRPLPEVAADLSRYFPTPIRVEGPARGLTFTGALKVDREEAVVGRLQAFLPVRADRSASQITLRSTAAPG